jgi:hypothetical protein
MSRRSSDGAVRTLRDHYRTAARKGDWPLCKLIAEQMRGLDGDGGRSPVRARLRARTTRRTRRSAQGVRDRVDHRQPAREGARPTPGGGVP